MKWEKLVEALFVITCMVVLTCGGFYLQSKIIKHVAGPSCNCIQK
jgi:hypothetical protein